jgi:membrane fusion protein, multidrug efflux system
MSTIQNVILKTKNLSLLTAIVFLTACGGGEKTESLSDLKTKQAELKTQLSEIASKISKLEGDSAKKFVLVEASAIIPQFFKTFINVQGRVDAEESVSLAAEMPGTITKINVKPGDAVSKGQVLAETDARVIQQQLAVMQTSLVLITQLYEKQKALWDQKIGTEVQFLQAKAMKEATEQSISGVQEQLRMTKIVSPINGTVDGVDIKLGQATAPGAPAIRVVNFSNLKIKADLAESYSAKVHKGNDVVVTFPDTDDSLTATINYSARSINQLNRTFGVEILLDGKKEFHPNQIATISINDYKSSKPVLSIPLTYVQKDLKGAHFVLVAENNKAAKRYITLGKEYNGKAEIKEGLTETDLLITSGYDGLNEGDALKIKQ